MIVVVPKHARCQGIHPYSLCRLNWLSPYVSEEKDTPTLSHAANACQDRACGVLPRMSCPCDVLLAIGGAGRILNSRGRLQTRSMTDDEP